MVSCIRSNGAAERHPSVDLRVMAARGAIPPTTRYLHENVQQWLGHLLKESCHIPLSIAMLFAPVRFTLHGEYASTRNARTHGSFERPICSPAGSGASAARI